MHRNFANMKKRIVEIRKKCIAIENLALEVEESNDGDGIRMLCSDVIDLAIRIQNNCGKPRIIFEGEGEPPT